MAKRKKTDIVPLMLRLREDLRKRIEDAADIKETSLNGEIVQRLEASFEQEEVGILRDRVHRSMQNLEEITRRILEMLELRKLGT
jgi:uncharacterized protein (DUF1778 family)